MMSYVFCHICSSQKPTHRPCGLCHDRDDEAAALYKAREAFASDTIDVSELEHLIEIALTAPPKQRFGIVLRYA